MWFLRKFRGCVFIDTPCMHPINISRTTVEHMCNWKGIQILTICLISKGLLFFYTPCSKNIASLVYDVVEKLMKLTILDKDVHYRRGILVLVWLHHDSIFRRQLRIFRWENWHILPCDSFEHLKFQIWIHIVSFEI
jgi:hypothetical protein